VRMLWQPRLSIPALCTVLISSCLLRKLVVTFLATFVEFYAGGNPAGIARGWWRAAAPSRQKFHQKKAESNRHSFRAECEGQLEPDSSQVLLTGCGTVLRVLWLKYSRLSLGNEGSQLLLIKKKTGDVY